MSVIGSDAWRWRARSVGDGKFLLRFPTANMANQWSRVKNLTLRNEALIKIEAWSPAVGAKGVHQSAWFRVTGIPTDQRSVRTLAKVGGLVGEVIEIDEESRFNYDYVRLRIACRDVARVPKTAESRLGMYLMDFGFEREVLIEGTEKMLKSGIKVTDENHPPAKKSKPDHGYVKGTNDGQNQNGMANMEDAKAAGKQKAIYSAPPKMDNRGQSYSGFMKDARKAYTRSDNADIEDGKVHIPETFEDSDSDSDSFSQRLGHLAGMGDHMKDG